MIREFIPYEQALALKGLGFNKNCLMSICIDGSDEYVKADFPKGENFNAFDLYVSLPLYQQAFKFFREKYNLHISIGHYRSQHDFKWGYNWSIQDSTSDKYYSSEPDAPYGEWEYEEAELARLIKLIEIVKTK